MASDDTAPPDPDVMSDLHQIIYLGAFTNDRVGHSAAIHGCICADFHIILDNDTTDLRDAFGATGACNKTKSVLTDLSAGMDNDPIAEQRVLDAHARPNETIAPHLRARANHGVWRNDRTAADRGSRPHCCSGLDDRPFFQKRAA